MRRVDGLHDTTAEYVTRSCIRTEATGLLGEFVTAL